MQIATYHARKAALLTYAFASTRSVQIATPYATLDCQAFVLCLHTLRADCNGTSTPLSPARGCFASTRSVQIATRAGRAGVCNAGPLPPHAPCRLQPPTPHQSILPLSLPPHAPCRLQLGYRVRRNGARTFASTRSVQIATKFSSMQRTSCSFASTRSVQIATLFTVAPLGIKIFASTRSVQIATRTLFFWSSGSVFASTRSVQIATPTASAESRRAPLCLHTLRADCNGRNAQNCNIHFSERVLSR